MMTDEIKNLGLVFYYEEFSELEFSAIELSLPIRMPGSLYLHILIKYKISLVQPSLSL